MYAYNSEQMGRKKRVRKVIQRKRLPKVATVFDCPFCSHSESVDCKITQRGSIRVGALQCRVCFEKFDVQVNELAAPIDVYSEWIDECETENPRHTLEEQQALDERDILTAEDLLYDGEEETVEKAKDDVENEEEEAEEDDEHES